MPLSALLLMLLAPAQAATVDGDHEVSDEAPAPAEETAEAPAATDDTESDPMPPSSVDDAAAPILVPHVTGAPPVEVSADDEASAREEAPARTPVKTVPLEAPASAEQSAADDPVTNAAARFGIFRVAVYDLERSGGINAQQARVVTDALLDELRKRRGLDVIGLREIEAMIDLESQKQVMGCDEDESCLVEIADALGVDAILVGTLTQVGSEYVVVARRIDQRQAKVAAAYSQRVAIDDGSELLATVGPAVQELFADHELREGERMGVDPEVALRLNPPPLSPWLFYGGGAAAALLVAGAAAAGAVSAVLFFGPYGSVLAAGAQPGGGSVDELLNLQMLINASGGTAWGLALGALLVGGATVALTPLTDFKGYGDAAELAR